MKDNSLTCIADVRNGEWTLEVLEPIGAGNYVLQVNGPLWFTVKLFSLNVLKQVEELLAKIKPEGEEGDWWEWVYLGTDNSDSSIVDYITYHLVRDREFTDRCYLHLKLSDEKVFEILIERREQLVLASLLRLLRVEVEKEFADAKI